MRRWNVEGDECDAPHDLLSFHIADGQSADTERSLKQNATSIGHEMVLEDVIYGTTPSVASSVCHGNRTRNRRQSAHDIHIH